MARPQSRQIMGYLPTEEKQYAAILSLVAPATPATRLLDPFAGEGIFLEAAANAWNVTPYANELDGERAQACLTRFGPTQAVRGDVERLSASSEAFGILWANPPYDVDKLDRDTKRVEFRYLRLSWKWLQPGGLAFWVIYQQHLTDAACAFLAKYSRRVDVWALPGKHQGEYNQIVVVAVKAAGQNPEAEALYADLIAQRTTPRLLTVQTEPCYRVPPPPAASRKFVFAPETIDPEQGLQLLQSGGAWKSQGFQALLEVAPPPAQIEPVVAPRPGHMALVLAAGVANGAVLDTAEYGRVVLRGKTVPVEKVVRVESEPAPGDPEHSITKTTKRLKPTTTLSLLGADGTLVQMEGDEALLGFITRNRQALAADLQARFQPMYRFDFNGLGSYLNTLRLNGKHPLYTAQQHVVGALTRGFQGRDSILLVGSMGVGKTALGSTAAIALSAGLVTALRDDMRPDQVVLIVAPPHLAKKWKRELASLHPTAYIAQLDRHEDVKAFMDKATLLGARVPKIGLIKRDLTKLGAGRETAVVWRQVPRMRWSRGERTPEGYTPEQRVYRQRMPTCPHCGAPVFQDSRGGADYASEAWLKGGKRSCATCRTPLWREARDAGSLPKAGEIYPSRNPRYRLDMYLKKRYPDRVYLLIWDEAHECQHSDTGNGASFGRLAGLASKVLAMTGTPFNGRASSLFNLEYVLNPRVRERYPWGGAPRLARHTRGARTFPAVLRDDSRQRGRAESQWVEAMGVREQIVEERPGYDAQTGAFTGTTTYERPFAEAPGISPLLVAEVLDHAVFFSLGDLGKALPEYTEIAQPVPMDADTGALYEQTREKLKQYLIERRWQGDVSFRGAYLQWAMGWPNTTHRPEKVIHNLKHPVTGQKTPHVVADLPSFGETRLFAKEQALLDLLRDELAVDRPCVVYVRQTSTRDIQPRLEQLIRTVPGAQPFILKNTVEAERREAVIEAEVKKGVNVIIANPELVKTGLDLLFFPTLIFHEITFNLGTMMQAAARSYRLNQTHSHCKVVYLYYEQTMEHTAVQLMSRKQRAAKLLTGDLGLTGLDALTEGDGGFEEALLDAIARDETLLDPSQLFQAGSAAAANAEDAAYWNAAPVQEPVPALAQPEVSAEPLTATPETVAPVNTPRIPPDLAADPLLRYLVEETGGRISAVQEPVPAASPVENQIAPASTPRQRPIRPMVPPGTQLALF